MAVIIYDAFDDVIFSIDVEDSSYRYRELCGEHYVRIEFALATLMDIPVGSYVIVDNERYTLLDPQLVTINNTTSYEYTIIFDAEQTRLKSYVFCNPIDKRIQFPLTAQPREHLQMLIDNLVEREPSKGWTIGRCITGTETLISYNCASCWEALTLMAQAFDTEWSIDGNAITLGKVGSELDYLNMSYGKGNGFKTGVSRRNYADEKVLVRMFAQGGERNIDPSKYGSKTLLMPRGREVKFDGSYFQGELGYNDKRGKTYWVSADGMSVRGSNNAIAEGSMDCTDIYPQRVGEVTNSVMSGTVEEPLVTIWDDTIPDNLDYSANKIAGEDMVIVFQSGMLAGREFKVEYYHTGSTTTAGRRFEIYPQVYDGVTMPSGNFLPNVGDKYAIFGISLPSAYIRDDSTFSGASWDMLRKVLKALVGREKPQYTFSGEVDGIWASKNWPKVGRYFVCGGYINLSAFSETNMRVRIQSIKTYINTPYAPEVTLSDKVVRFPYMSRQTYSQSVLEAKEYAKSQGLNTTIHSVQAQALSADKKASEAVEANKNELYVVEKRLTERIDEVEESIPVLIEEAIPTQVATAPQLKVATSATEFRTLSPNIVYDYASQSLSSFSLPPLFGGNASFDNRWTVRVALGSSNALTLPTNIRWKDGVAPSWSSWCICELTFRKDSNGSKYYGEWSIYK